MSFVAPCARRTDTSATRARPRRGVPSVLSSATWRGAAPTRAPKRASSARRRVMRRATARLAARRVAGPFTSPRTVRSSVTGARRPVTFLATVPRSLYQSPTPRALPKIATSARGRITSRSTAPSVVAPVASLSTPSRDATSSVRCAEQTVIEESDALKGATRVVRKETPPSRKSRKRDPLTTSRSVPCPAGFAANEDIETPTAPCASEDLVDSRSETTFEQQ